MSFFSSLVLPGACGRGRSGGRQRGLQAAAALFRKRCSAFSAKVQDFSGTDAGLFCRGAPEEAAARGGEGSSGFPGGGVEDGLLRAFVVDLGRLVEEISVCRECFWRKRAGGVIFVLPEEAVGSAGGNH